MNTHILRLITSPKVIYVVGVVGGGLIGSGVTILVLEKKIEKKYSDIADREITEAKEFYKRQFKADEFADLSLVVEDLEVVATVAVDTTQQIRNDMVAEASRIAEAAHYVSYNDRSTAVAQTEEERVEVVGSIRKSVWDDRSLIETDEFDPEGERMKQAQGKPYILDHDAFYENPDERKQFTMTYYEEDDVLLDEADRPVPNKTSLVGEGNLRFGYGTHQENIVLIHNPLIGVDYEVTREKGSWARDVLRFEPKERKRSPGKFRDSDD